jgi:hypothetical protein
MTNQVIYNIGVTLVGQPLYISHYLIVESNEFLLRKVRKIISFKMDNKHKNQKHK